MIAPSYWVDPHNGNNYFLTVQYTNQQIGSMTMENFKNIPLHAHDNTQPTVLENVADIRKINTPTEVDHYQLFRVIDVYISPKGEDLGALSRTVGKVLDDTRLPPNIRVDLRGSVVSMRESFLSFGLGLLLAIVLVYLVLMAQFASFVDPFIILLAIPSGITGVILFLLLTHTTLNVMSLMGVLMLIGIADSNSILIVDFAHKLEEQGRSVADAVVTACRVRLRPILMTSLATIIGMLPMAMKLGTGGEQYTPMARAIIGGLTASVLLTVFIVPAAYLLAYGHKDKNHP
jgi:multidrug efflux pump subunit AcrB